MAKKGDVNTIAVLVLFFNKLNQTMDCIRSFIPSGQMIYVLNNGSSEDQWLNLQQTFAAHSNVKYYNAGRNLGATGGRNYLIQQTAESWIFLVDNDVTVKQETEWVSLFHSFLKKEPDAKLISCNVFNLHENAFTKQLRVVKQDRKVHIEAGDFAVTNTFSACGTIVNRSVFEIYGMFDEKMFVGMEEYEYTLRTMQSPAGEIEVFQFNDIEIIHDHRFQKKTADKEAIKLRYNNEMLQSSYNHMVKKYDIVLDHDFEWWSKKQVVTMTVPRWKILLQNLITKLLRK
jgi:GT2 family glycosyltransferase